MSGLLSYLMRKHIGGGTITTLDVIFAVEVGMGAELLETYIQLQPEAKFAHDFIREVIVVSKVARKLLSEEQ